MMHTGSAIAAVEALTDLVDTIRVHRDRADREGRRAWVQTWEALGAHLDRVRTILVQEGDPYLSEAWGYVDAGRLTLARNLVRMDRSVAHAQPREHVLSQRNEGGVSSPPS